MSKFLEQYRDRLVDATKAAVEFVDKSNGLFDDMRMETVGAFTAGYLEACRVLLDQVEPVVAFQGAGAMPPPNPIRNQGWYSTVDDQLFVFDGVFWKGTQSNITIDTDGRRHIRMGAL